jgi:hypothetical protein
MALSVHIQGKERSHTSPILETEALKRAWSFCSMVISVRDSPFSESQLHTIEVTFRAIG